MQDFLRMQLLRNIINVFIYSEDNLTAFGKLHALVPVVTSAKDVMLTMETQQC
jgi:hypothetical protein